jgi:hypothetical protein
MSLTFQPMASLNSVPMIGDNDSLVVMTTAGPRRILKSALTAGLAQNLPAITEFNAAASEVAAAPTLGAYGFASLVPTTFNYWREAALDSVAFSAAYTYDGVQDTTRDAAFRFNGTLPKTGKYWMSVNADMTALTSANSQLALYILNDIGDLAVNGSNAKTSILISKTMVSWFVEGSMSNPTIITTSASQLKSLLIAFNCDANTVTIYGPSGQQAILNFGSAGLTLGGRALCGIVFVDSSDYGKTLKMTFNTTTPATSPVAIPSGFTGLQLINAVLPPYVVQGMGIRSTTASSYRGQAINAYDSYLLGSDRLLLLTDIYRTPQLNKNNLFTKPQTLQQYIVDYGTFFPGGQGAPIVIARNQEAILIQAQTANQGLLQTISFGASNFGGGGYGIQYNTVVGFANYQQAVSATYNTGFGQNVFNRAVNGVSYNVGFGQDAGSLVRKATYNTAVGYQALKSTGYNMVSTVAVGQGALSGYVDAGYNGTNDTGITTKTGMVAIGSYAMGSDTTAGLALQDNAVAIGIRAGYKSNVGPAVMIGSDAGNGASNATGTVAIGSFAFGNGSGTAATGLSNVAIGSSAMSGAKQAYSVAVGQNALISAVDPTGTNSVNVAIGSGALNAYTGTQSTGVGAGTLNGALAFTNATALGYSATVTGDNQVQLGNSATTTYTYGAVQNRSDIRDKTDVRNTELGLDFIMALRPVDFRWDMRDDYIDYASMPVAPEPMRPEPVMGEVELEDVQYQPMLLAYKADHAAWEEELKVYTLARDQYEAGMVVWVRANDFNRMVHDGTHTRKRFHHGFIAQEVKQVVDDQKTDFGGFQDHLKADGKDVKSLGYEEFIAPMVRAIQQINVKTDSEIYIDQIARRVVEVMKEQGLVAVAQ